MDCTQVQNYLDEYVDGFLTAEVQAQVEAHLLTCTECKRTAEALANMRKELHALRLEDTSDFEFDFARAKAPAIMPKRGWLRAVCATAACFVLLIGVYGAVQNGYNAPVVQELSADTDKESAEIALANEKMEESVQAETGPVQRDFVPYVENDFVVPEGATIFSSREVVEKSQAVRAIEADAQPAAANMPIADDAENEQTACAGGTSAVQYEKRSVTLAVDAGAKESFLQLLSGIQLSEFNGECVIDETDLQSLLEADGVALVAEETATVQTDVYNGKVVIQY